MKPTVGHFVDSYLFSTGSWVYHQLVNMSRYRPVVVTSKVENLDQFPLPDVYRYRQRFEGPTYLQVGLRKTYEALTRSRIRFYTEIVSRHEARLLHSHFGDEGYYNLGVMRSARLPMVTTFYGYDLSRLPQSQPKWRGRYRQLFAEGALFLAEGSHMAQCLVDLGCPADKVVVQNLGVDLRRIPFRPRIRAAGEPVNILLAARFTEKKGIPYGISAFAAAARKLPGIQLRIVGGATVAKETQLMEECKRLAAQEGVADQVHFLGPIPYTEYLREVDRAHLFLAPSVTAKSGDTEGGAPVSVIEASAAGLPVISSNHCDIPEVVLHGKSGLLVAERDVSALTSAILELASAPQEWPRMGQEGRRHVEAEYDVLKQVARLESIYDGLQAGCL